MWQGPLFFGLLAFNSICFRLFTHLSLTKQCFSPMSLLNGSVLPKRYNLVFRKTKAGLYVSHSGRSSIQPTVRGLFSIGSTHLCSILASFCAVGWSGYMPSFFMHSLWFTDSMFPPSPPWSGCEWFSVKCLTVALPGNLQHKFISPFRNSGNFRSKRQLQIAWKSHCHQLCRLADLRWPNLVKKKKGNLWEKH